MKGSLFTLFLISIALMSIQALRVSSLAGQVKLRHGSIIAFRNMADTSVIKYLDANTNNGNVNLAPSTKGIYSGTHWKVHANSDGSYSFENLGTTHNANHKFLDGRTRDGSLGLAPNTNAPWTGTRWRVKRLSDGTYALRNLGDFHSCDFKFLDAYIDDNTAYLSPETDGDYTGTHWKIVNLITPIRPRIGVTRPSGRTCSCGGDCGCSGTCTCSTGWDQANIHNGEIIAFKNIVDGQDPKYLDGNTNNGNVNLAPSIHGIYSGTRWKVHGHSDGSYSFENLGTTHNCEHKFLDGRTVDGSLGLAPNTNAPWTGTRWKVIKMSDGTFALRNLGHIKNDQHKFLDSYFADNRVYLSPRTDGMYTGTHWRIFKTTAAQ